MTSKNEITGDAIQTKVITDTYRNNFDAIFRKPRKCIIRVYGVDIDVVQLYKDKGFDVLPPVLTISVSDMYRLGSVALNYSLVRYLDDGFEPLNTLHSIIVNDGDEFIAVPPATYS